MSKFLFVCAFSAIVSLSFGLSCTSPTVESVSSFTTQDATIVSQIAFITEFTLKCDNKASESSPLFAEIDGKLSPVSRIGTDKFQVSIKWLINSTESFVRPRLNSNYFSHLLRWAGPKKPRKPSVATISFVCSTKKVSLLFARLNVRAPMFHPLHLWPKSPSHTQAHSMAHMSTRKCWPLVSRSSLPTLHSQQKANFSHKPSHRWIINIIVTWNTLIQFISIKVHLNGKKMNPNCKHSFVIVQIFEM